MSKKKTVRKQDVRADKICVTCGIHTVQKKGKHGWVCTLCHTVQPKGGKNV